MLQRIQNTTDTLQDLTGRNVTDFLLKKYEESGRSRYSHCVCVRVRMHCVCVSPCHVNSSDLQPDLSLSLLPPPPPSPRYGGISVGGVNSQVRMTAPEIEATIMDLKILFNSSMVGCGDWKT